MTHSSSFGHKLGGWVKKIPTRMGTGLKSASALFKFGKHSDEGITPSTEVQVAGSEHPSPTEPPNLTTELPYLAIEAPPVSTEPPTLAMEPPNLTTEPSQLTTCRLFLHDLGNWIEGIPTRVRAGLKTASAFFKVGKHSGGGIPPPLDVDIAGSGCLFACIFGCLTTCFGFRT
ncbi:MAG: hypothetical protein M1819_004812 [Sarea resinae]|nr:MAG: hypothetical protein M1819_004812 [Sarea resinae]